ncbi:hypothetical protein B0H16DRAFT_1433724 [Mycena metata]|uniref:BRCT domain-containing protein n=1 Tax=Mycena metata TaxID=1033252 RepID=A0AAD7HDN2_9AGAR|nr:hypothetical protein B0H16DRAFT_1433724 [Mycena metata]
MHRRANKSKKVPNVRLRPAHPDAMARARPASPEAASCWAQDSQIVGSDDTVLIGGSCPRPFRNVVVCATGILDKPELFKLALELGATSVSAFTDRVTHLVAENHGGAKYQCALERKIPILLPSWIIESHRIWQHGDDVDLAQSVAQHRLPPFAGVTLCISGIPDILRRTTINKALTAGGGTYVKDLVRPVRVTHLLCSGEAGVETDKMRYADKFNRAGEADPPIQIVWEEWFWDSLEYGGQFDEGKYQAGLPRPERRATRIPRAPVPSVPSSSSNSNNSHNSVPPASAPPSLGLNNNNTNFSSAYDDDLEDGEPLIARVQRPQAMALQLWGSLLKARGYAVDEARKGVMLSPEKKQQARAAAMQDPEPDQEGGEGGEAKDNGKGKGRESVLSSFRRQNSVVVAARGTAVAAGRNTPTSGAGPSRMPFGRSATGGNLLQASTTTNAAAEDSMQVDATDDPSPPSTVFQSLRFLLRGETDTPTVRGAIEGAGGVVRASGEEYDFVVVRLVSGSPLFRADPSPLARARYRTECWLEQCLFADKLVSPDAHCCFVPLGVEVPVTGASKITLSFSGLEANEACWVRRMLKALGITLAPAFSRSTTHLLCPSATGPKYTRAREWGVPVVGMRWLAAMAKEGRVPEVGGFLVGGGEEVPQVQVGKGKGKEKEKEKEETMLDITNKSQSPPADAANAYFLPPLPPPPAFGEAGPALSGNDKQSCPPPPASPSPPKKKSTLVRRQSTSANVNMSRSPLRMNSSPVRPPTPLALVEHAVPGTQSSVGSPSTAGSGGSAVPVTRTSRGLVRRATTFPAPAPARGDSLTRDGGPSLRARALSSSSPARVPSSTSPSPLRPRGVSVSPPKIPDHRTKALQDSIVSLLGQKRPATPDEGDSMGAGGAGRVKRGKHRSKPQSRQPSDLLPVAAAPDADSVAHRSHLIFGAGRGRSRSLSPAPDVDGESYEGFSLGNGNDEQSLRVMYEDPGQRAELQRLASLIGEPFEGSGGVVGVGRRGEVRGGVRGGLGVDFSRWMDGRFFFASFLLIFW